MRILVGLLGLALILLAGTAAGENLIVNPSFESGLDGWTASGTAALSTPGHTGDGVEMLAAWSEDPQWLQEGVVLQYVPVSPGAEYRFGFWSRTNGQSIHGVELIWLDSSGGELNSLFYEGGGSSWTYEENTVVAPAGAAQVLVRAYAGWIDAEFPGPGWLWVDDFLLEGDPLTGLGGAAAAAWVDFDGDDDLDLHLVRNGEADVLLMNDGGAFTDVSVGVIADAGAGNCPAWGDYDNDGDPDLYLVRDGEVNRLIRNDGGGGFSEVTPAALADPGSGWKTSWVDYDQDGLLDLYLLNRNGGNHLLRSLGELAGQWYFIENSGALAFTADNRSAAWGDYDGDGDQDVYVAVDFEANRLYENGSQFGFLEVGNGTYVADTGSGEGTAWGDYDNDGDLDLYLVRYNTADRLFRRTAAGWDWVQGAPLGDNGPGRGVTWVDYDNDGDLDLHVVRYNRVDLLLRNDGAGVFTSDATFIADTDGPTVGGCWGDYDNDGDLDLLVVDEVSCRLIQNNGTGANHWLQLDLEGVESNRGGIGARVRAVTGAVSQIRDVGCGSGGLSHDALTASFGLGAAASVDTLEIRWPSGIVQVLTSVVADQRLHVVEQEQGGGGLVAYYPFDGDATDASGNGNDGIVSGAVPVAGRRGSALQFDGVDDRVDIGTGVRPLLPATLTAWARVDSLPYGGYVITTDMVDGNHYYYGLAMLARLDGTLEGKTGSGGVASPYTRYSKRSLEPVIRLGSWQHLAVVFNSRDDFQLYVDGVEVEGEYVGSGKGLAYSSSYHGSIGTSTHSPQSRVPGHFAGALDEVRVYDRALSAQEIQALLGHPQVVVSLDGDLDNVAGMDDGATDGYDVGTDLPEDADGSRLRFLHPEWGIPGVTAFKHDLRAVYDARTESRTWTIEAEFPNQTSTTRVARIVFSPSFTAVDSIGLTLHDVTAGRVVDLFPGLAYEYLVPPWTTDVRTLDLTMGPYGWSAEDADADGVLDLVDACPGENASFFDRDGDGCLDEVRGARHVEYWSADDLPLPYVVHEAGAPGIGDGSDLAAIQAGFAAWTAIPGADVSIAYQGTTPQADAQALDMVNLVTFADPDFVFPSGVLAVGLSTSFTSPVGEGEGYRPGQIVDSDMIFNPAMDFRTATAGAGTDIRSVVTHEAGHMLGLSHSAVPSATMYYVLPPGTEAASLSTEDELAMLRAYPAAATVAAASRLRGTVTDGLTGEPLAGVAVFAIDAAGGDTLACDYTLPADGSYDFVGLPDGDYLVAIHALDGTAAVGYLTPAHINAMLHQYAATLVVPEYWDAAESGTDDPTAMTPVAVAAGVTARADLVSNIDGTPPAVLAVSPDDGTTDVAVDAAVLVRFSEAIDGESLRGGFSLRPAGGGDLLPGSAALVEDGRTLAYVPAANLDFASAYLVEVGAEVRDLHGNPLGGAFTATFTTQARPPVSMTSLSPRKGVAGSVVVIGGEGFAADPALDAVSFGPLAAAVTSASATELVAVVPEAAIPGPLEVRVTNLDPASGQTSNALVFTVLAPDEEARGIEIAAVDLPGLPRDLAVAPDGAQVYVATDAGLSVVGVGDPSTPTQTALAVAGGLQAVAVPPGGGAIYAVGQAGESLYRFQAEPPALLDEHGLGAVPRGLLVGPSGRRAYVPTDEGAIQVWDVDQDSGTFGSQIGEAAGGWDLLGPLAMDPTGGLLLAPLGDGRLLFYDVGRDSVVDSVPLLADPRDVAVHPAGGRAYVSDGSGYLSVIDLDGRVRLRDIPTGGTLRGVALTAGGALAYADDHQLNYLDVIDLREGAPTAWSMTARLPQRVDPVDVAFSPGGDFVYSLVERERKLVILASGAGPELASMVPVAGPVGAKVVLTGSGFGGASVSFNGVPAAVERGDDSMLVTTVPPGATSGPVTVLGAVPGEVSGPRHFEVLGPSGGGGLRRSAAVAYGSGGAIASASEVSPDCDMMVVGTYGGAYIIDVDPDSPDFLQVVQQAHMPFGDRIDDIAIAPDGSLAYLVLMDDPEIQVLDVDRDSPTFGQIVREIAVGDRPDWLTVGPDHRYLVVANGSAEDWNCRLVELASDAVQVIDLGDAGVAHAVGAFHPGGGHAYISSAQGPNPTIDVVDLTDPLDPAFAQVIHRVELPAGSGSFGAGVVDLSFTPDGSRAYVLVEDWDSIAPVSLARILYTLDCADPAVPGLMGTQPLDGYEGAGYGPSRFSVSPAGDVAVLYLVPESRLLQLELPSATVITESTHAGSHPGYDADGSHLFAVHADTLDVFDFSAELRLAAVWGDGQTGVAGSALDSPLRVQVSGLADGAPAPAVPVRFEILSGGGQLRLPGGQVAGASLVVASDRYGYAQVEWALGAELGAQQVSAGALGAVGSPLTYTATAVADPQAEPLVLVEGGLSPADGAGDVGITTAVQAVFSRPVDPATVHGTGFYLSADGGATAVPAVLGLAGGLRKVSLTPKEALEHGTDYTVVVGAGIRDADGGSLQNPATVSFSTEAPPPAPTLTAASPPGALPAVTVVLSGSGFARDRSLNQVWFEGVAASITRAAPDRLRVKVPLEATSGTVRVSVEGRPSNEIPFNVLAPLTAPSLDPLGQHPTGPATMSVAMSPGGAIVYAVSPEADQVIPFRLWPFHSLPGIPVGDEPWAIDTAPAGSYAYVANRLSGDVSIIDIRPESPTWHQVVASVQVGAQPVDLVAAPAGDRVLVACSGSEEIGVIDSDRQSASFHAVIATIAAGSAVRTVTISPDGSRIFAGTDLGYLVLDAVDHGVLARVDTGSAVRSVTISPDGTLLVVLDMQGDIWVYDVVPDSPTEHQVLARVGTGSAARSVTISPDGARLFVVPESGNLVLVYALEYLGAVGARAPDGVLSPISLELTQELTVGENPRMVAFDPGGSGQFAVTNAGDNTLSLFGGATAVPVDRVRVRGSLRADCPGAAADLAGAFLDVHRAGDGGFVRTLAVDGAGGYRADLPPGDYVFSLVPPSGYAPVVEEATLSLTGGMEEGRDWSLACLAGRPARRPMTFWRHQVVAALERLPGAQVGEAELCGHLEAVQGRFGTDLDDPVLVLGTAGGGCGRLLEAAGDLLGSGERPDDPAGGARRQLLALLVNVVSGRLALGESISEDGASVSQAITHAHRTIDGGTAQDVRRVEAVLQRINGGLAVAAGGVPPDTPELSYDETPARFALERSYPNPFNPTAVIGFALPRGEHVRLRVYDLAGRLVRTLLDEPRPAGRHAVEWDGRDDRGRGVATGAYLYRLEAGKFVQTRKMMLVR